MAKQVASLFATLRLDDGQFRRGLDQAQSGLRGARDRLDGVSRAARNVGMGLTAGVTAPLLGAAGAAVRLGVDFDRSMQNAASITGETGDAAARTRREILQLGASARMGPQAVADAYYQIVSGVQDADSQMAILNASIATAEAGSADLSATTAGLVSVMNAYGMEADQAAFVSDTLTRTVGMGVGSMDQFTGALGPAAGLAYDLGIGFDELASNTAFLTSTGSSASEAVTQLTGVMSAFLKPNADMQAALEGMGYETGQAAIQALGLQGAVQALYGEVGTTDAVAQAVGTQEALGGALALNSDRAVAFNENFVAGIDGATEAAREIQGSGAAAAFDRIMAAGSAAGIALGGVLLPPLAAAAEKVTPFIMKLTELNPELLQMGALVLAGAAAIGPLALALGVVLSPAGLLIGAIGGLLVLMNQKFDGGLIGVLGRATTAAQQLAFIGLFVLNKAATSAGQVVDIVRQKIQDMIGAINDGLDKIREMQDAVANSRTGQGVGGAVGIGGLLASGQVTPGQVAGEFRRELFGFADGGRPPVGVPSVVGERGPELFVPDSAGTVIPNEMMGGTVNINMTVTEGSARQAGANFAEGFESVWRGRQ